MKKKMFFGLVVVGMVALAQSGHENRDIAPVRPSVTESKGMPQETALSNLPKASCPFYRSLPALLEKARRPITLTPYAQGMAEPPAGRSDFSHFLFATGNNTFINQCLRDSTDRLNQTLILNRTLALSQLEFTLLQHEAWMVGYANGHASVRGAGPFSASRIIAQFRRRCDEVPQRTLEVAASYVVHYLADEGERP